MTVPTIRFHGRQHTARTLALTVLISGHLHEGFVQERLDAALHESPLLPADRRLATQLTYGVLRRHGTLLALLQPFLSRPFENIEPWLLDCLCLGTFQLLLCDQIPPHAAVHETVELARQFGRSAARGFLNAVLRKISDLITGELADAPAGDALPLEGCRYRKLARPILPTDAVAYLSAGFSLPLWMAQRWSDRFGPDECRRLGFWFLGPAPMTLRVNPLRTTREDFIEACRQGGREVEPGSNPQAVRLLESASVRELPGYEQGWFCVQDETAMQAAPALLPEPGGRYLDLCAAPGGKSTHLAELMDDRGTVFASDDDPERLAVVMDLARRLGHVAVRRLSPKMIATQFDGVLVDVPCSNTGVLGRRPEVRWRLRPEEFGYLTGLQERLLRQALDYTKPGGAVVYSTCSIEPEENRAVVERVVKQVPGLVIEAEQESIPGQPSDGGYWARLRVAK